MNEDAPPVPAQPQTTRERFAEIARRNLEARGYTNGELDDKLRDIMSRIDWSKVTNSG